MILYDIIGAISKRGDLKERNGITYRKMDETGCDEEIGLTVYYYWVMSQNKIGWWVKGEKVFFTEELK
jgi:hypothetical protein